MSGFVLRDGKVETIDVTPTWEGILPAYIEMIAREAAVMAADPETMRMRREGRDTAVGELHKMARLADKYVASKREPSRRERAAALLSETDIDGILSDEVVPTCDICGEQWEDGGEGEDWNGETGNHFSCEAGQ